MVEIRDFKCTYDNSAGLNAEITSGLDLHFPEAHLSAESMIKLALAIKAHDGAPFCELPFCHTVEAEALGARINLGNEATGPRAGEPVYTKMEELLDLPDMDFTKGRLCEVLKTARALTAAGEPVMFEVCGPITILSALIDPKQIFKTMRKNPDLAQEIFAKTGAKILKLVDEIKACGVTMISYADVVGGVNILGPKMSTQMMNLFTADFVKELAKRADEHMTICFCPKTTYALIDTGHAQYEPYQLPEPMGYQDACVYAAGKVAMLGQMCVKNGTYQLTEGVIKQLVLI